MRKKLLCALLGFVAIFTLFIGTPANYAHASEAENMNEIQQDEQFVSIIVEYKTYPPLNHYYDDGYYKGYISRVSYDYVDGTYYTLYAGRVYRNAPIGS